MAAISQPMIAHDAADSVWRAAKAIHEDNQVPIQLSNLRHAVRDLEGVAAWARKAGTSSYRSNSRVRIQLINAAGGITMCVSQLIELIDRLEADPKDADALVKTMLLRTVIKQINFAPPLDVKDLKGVVPDGIATETAKLVKQLGTVEAVEPQSISSIFGVVKQSTVDPLSDEE